MLKVKTYGYILVSIPAIWLMFSCETNLVQKTTAESSQSKTLNINFQDNILNQNPIEASSASERFIRDLVFDPFFGHETTSSIIKQYSFDTLNSSHRFTINREKRFHDGSSVDTQTIQQFFKYLIKHHWDKEPVSVLFSAMEGFSVVQWYRENRNVLDSLPPGFQVLNDSVFQIKLVRENALLKEWFMAPEFRLFKSEGVKYIGTGSYQLSELNQDIQAQLVKSNDAQVQIEKINISFIKNQAIVLAEFLEGSLDLITYNKMENPAMAKNATLTKLLIDKYPEYQVQTCDQLIVAYAELNSITDSILVNQILSTINIEKDSIYYLVSNSPKIHMLSKSQLKNSTPIDSSMYDIALVQGGRLPAMKYFTNTDYPNYIEIDEENLNPIEKHIVIEEVTLDSLYVSKENSSIELLHKGLKNPDLNIFLILEVFPTYVIYNNKLNGISENQSLSLMTKSMYYSDPKIY